MKKARTKISPKISIERKDENTIEEYIRRVATDKSLKLGHPLSPLTLKKYREKLPKIAREIRAKFKKSLKEISEDELKLYVAEEINDAPATTSIAVCSLIFNLISPTGTTSR